MIVRRVYAADMDNVIIRMMNRSTIKRVANQPRSLSGICLHSPIADVQFRWNSVARKYQYSFYGAK